MEIVNNKRIGIVYLIIFSVILIPVSIKLKNMPELTIAQLIIFSVLIINLIRVLIKQVVIIRYSLFIILYALFSIFIIVAILTGAMLGVQIQIADIFEIYKIITYLCMFIIISSIINNRDEIIRILRFTSRCIIVSSIVAFTQYFDILGLNEKYVYIIAPTQYFTLINDYFSPRVVGLFSNPNAYAYLLGVGLVVNLGLYINDNKGLNLIFFIFNAAALFMTGSRTGILFTCISMTIFISVYFGRMIFLFKMNSKEKGKQKDFKKLIIILTMIVVLTFIAMVYLPDIITWRLLEGMNLSTSTSFQGRINKWEEVIQVFMLSPFLGIGPAKIQYRGFHTDNEWLFLLRQYGIIGTLYLMATFILPILYQKNKMRDALIWSIFISLSLGSLFYMITAYVYHSFEVMPIFIIIYSLIFTKEKIFIKIC